MTSTDHPHLTTTLTTTTHSPHAPTTHHQAHDLHRSPMQPHNSYIPSPCSPCNLTAHSHHHIHVFIFHTHQTHFSLYLLHCSFFMKLISHIVHNSPIVQPTLPHTSSHPTMTTHRVHTSSSHAPTASTPSPTTHTCSLKLPHAT